MAIKEALEFPYAFSTRKKWGPFFDMIGQQNGFYICQQNGRIIEEQKQNNSPDAGIYTVRSTKNGNRTVRRPFYTNNPATDGGHTEAHAKFRAAILLWQGMTTEAKEIYKKRSVGRHMSGYNLFIREYMKT